MTLALLSGTVMGYSGLNWRVEKELLCRAGGSLGIRFAVGEDEGDS